MDTRTVNVLSLCTGYGGLDLGLKLAVPTARTVCCVEWEAYCCEVLARRMEEGWLDDCPIWTNLATFDGRMWRGIVDIVIGGYPCQPFSLAGQRKGEGDDRWVWPHIARIIREVQPALVFLENVPGHLSCGFRAVGEELCGMGYGFEAGLFSAAGVGAPHRRERLFILGYAASYDRGILLQSGKPRQASSDTGGAGADVAHANSEGLPFGSSKRRNDGEKCEAIERNRFPLFPPGPADRDAWARVLGQWPELAPAVKSPIRGVADGGAGGVGRAESSTRSHELRALGNGVIPLVAAVAWRVLSERIARR